MMDDYKHRLTEAVLSLYVFPAGRRDASARWYPSISLDCCKHVRQPSKNYPDSLLNHQRTYKHIANHWGVSEQELKYTHAKYMHDYGILYDSANKLGLNVISSRQYLTTMLEDECEVTSCSRKG